MIETQTLLIIAPLLLVVVGGLGMMLADAFVRTAAAELSLVTAVILFAAAATALGLWFGPDVEAPAALGTYLASDRFAYFLDIVICGGGAIAALLGGGYLREHGLERGEFYVILLFSALGGMALSRAVDLLTIFIGLETMSLGIYGLVAFRRHSPRAAEGALKYYLLGSFASAILLFGMALLYGATGQTNLAAINGAMEAINAGTNEDGAQTLVILGLFLVVVGLAFKIAAVPFHMWAPDAYEGAVTPATTFMAVVVKAAVFGVMLRVFFALDDETLANESAGWPPALAGLSALTMIVGNFGAIVQKSVKRMLAYSSVAHAGYALLGLVAAWKLGEVETGKSAVLFYVAAYAVSNLLAFGSLILIGSRGKEAATYDDLAGVGRRHPIVALPMALGVLSLMGFPPTAGFFAKYYVIIAAVQSGGGMVWLAVLAVVTSAVGAYYYLRVIVVMFMKQPEEGAPIAVPMRSGYVVAALVLCSYFVVRMGVSPGAYLALVSSADGAQLPDLWTFAIDAGVSLLIAMVAAAITSREPAVREEPAPSA